MQSNPLIINYLQKSFSTEKRNTPILFSVKKDFCNFAEIRELWNAYMKYHDVSWKPLKLLTTVIYMIK